MRGKLKSCSTKCFSAPENPTWSLNMSDFSVTVKSIMVREVNDLHGKKHTACIINHRWVTHDIKCKLCVFEGGERSLLLEALWKKKAPEERLKVVSVYVLCTDVDLMDRIDFMSNCVYIFFLYFQGPSRLLLIDNVQTLHFKGGIVGKQL